jgi:hypothetical protein
MATVDDDAAQGPAWFRQDPRQVQEWLRQNNLIYGGLIAIGVALVQPFLTAASLDLSAFVGVVAGFWHILWVAGVGMLVSGIVAVAVHSAGYVRLERDQAPTPPEAEAPGDSESSPHRRAGDGNRTRVTSLEGSSSAIELHPRGSSWRG